MAKKKAASKPATPRPATLRLSVQASPEWIAWVDGGAEHCRTDVSKLVDAALVEYLKGKGFEERAPRRVP